LPGTRSRYEQKKTEAIERYNHAISKYEATIKRRNSAHDKLREKAIRQNEEVDLFRTAYRTGNTEAVVAFSQFTLERSQLPDGFHNEHRHAYLPEDRQIVVEYRLPTIEDVIPDVERYRYTKSRDTIDKVARSAKSRQSLYTEVVAQVVLRAVSEIFRSDDAQVGEVVTVNGIVKDIDPATGQEVQPCIISVRCTREQYSSLNLRNVDAIACLRRLNAAVSRSAAELVPVKPILEFDMVDPRFIKEDDVISKLDNRTNLMDLSPSDFEHLITNLFQKMGLETRLTQASRDGGVDCVAYDVRPILGGKVVIQAKRYKNTVGVSAVRDLFGTMHNEGANKGILVTTSGYGTAAHEFATGKPIELITGSNLLYLLKEHAGLDAKIEAPADWIDAAAAE
jgi:restriction system protein